MAITLDQFRTISNGSHNVGQIAISDDGSGLQKINNHIWQTGKNNYVLTGDQNRAVREALVLAFKGQVANRTMAVIEELLLGGGRARLSLSRDFVKQLINRATSPNARAGLDLGDMVNVGKSLLSRSIKVASGGGKPPSGLMTSGLDVAFKAYVSESMDQSVVNAQKGLAGVSEPLSRTDPMALMASVKQVVSSVAELVRKDSRISHLPKLADIEKNINIARFCETNGELVKTDAGVVKFKNLLEREIRSAFRNADIPRKVRNDLLSRVFTAPAVFSNVGDRLREDFDDIASGLIVQRDDRPLKSTLGGVYVNFLRAIENAVKSDESLTSPQKDAVLSKIYVNIGFSGARNTKETEMMVVADDGFNVENDEEEVTTASQRLEKFLLKELDSLFDISGNPFMADLGDIKQKCIDGLVELGLGI